MGCSNWAQILCGNVSWVETPSCVFVKILYGGSLGPMRNPYKISRRSHTVRGLFGHFLKNAKNMRLMAIFQLEWPSMGCSDWSQIVCGNVSWVEEHLLKISRDFHARFGRCFRTGGGSWARRARSRDIWRAVALSEGTSLKHERDALLRFWRNFVWWELGSNEEPTQNFPPIARCSGAVWAFCDKCKGYEVNGHFPIGMAFDRCSDWAQILCENVSRVEEHLFKISCDFHPRFGRCFRTGVGGG